MLIRKAFKFRLQPKPEQEIYFQKAAGCRRFVFNCGLAASIEKYKNTQKSLSYADLCLQLALWKKLPELSWLKEIHSQVLQQALKDLSNAYKNFFDKRAEFPTFKKKGKSDSFRYPQGVIFDNCNSSIFLPKFGWVKFRNSRKSKNKLAGTIKNATISLSAGKWNISIQTEQEVANPLPASNSAIGVDVGIANFAALSDGSFIKPLNAFKTISLKLRKQQRKLARQQKFSTNWQQTKSKIQMLHRHYCANARLDFIHKSSTLLSNNHAMIVVEDLRIKNMSKSDAGTIANPGISVKQKSGLNRAILDQAWGEFFRQLQYKLQWNGGQLLSVDPKHTSQHCPHCLHTHKDNRKTQALFSCVKCGLTANADTVASFNILRAGFAQLACQASGSSMPPATGTTLDEVKQGILVL